MGSNSSAIFPVSHTIPGPDFSYWGMSILFFYVMVAIGLCFIATGIYYWGKQNGKW